MPVFLRPLAIGALEEELPVNVSHEPGDVALMLLGDLVKNNNDPLDIARCRYKEITDESQEPVIVPMHNVIMNHVIRPLKEAKQCYVLGMPIACIAQAGLVGEMVALWRFRMLEPTIDGRLFDEVLQKLLMGREFDKMGQECRIRVLRALDTFEEQTVHAFTELRSLRRQYLHFMVDPQRDADADARKALQHANALVVKTLALTFNDGRIVLPPKIMRYIRDILNTANPYTPAGDPGEGGTE